MCVKIVKTCSNLHSTSSVDNNYKQVSFIWYLYIFHIQRQIELVVYISHPTSDRACIKKLFEEVGCNAKLFSTLSK